MTGIVVLILSPVVITTAVGYVTYYCCCCVVTTLEGVGTYIVGSTTFAFNEVFGMLAAMLA